jgi:quercetin dioxygenase-like cupin family protein
VEIRNRDLDAPPFTTKDGSTIREYLRTARQSLAEATLGPGGSTQRHYHAVSEEIYTLLEGSGRMEVDGVEAEVGAGDSILIPPGAWHAITAGPDGVRFLCSCAPPYADADTYFD